MIKSHYVDICVARHMIKSCLRLIVKRRGWGAPYRSNLYTWVYEDDPPVSPSNTAAGCFGQTPSVECAYNTEVRLVRHFFAGIRILFSLQDCVWSKLIRWITTMRVYGYSWFLCSQIEWRCSALGMARKHCFLTAGQAEQRHSICERRNRLHLSTMMVLI